MGYLSAEEHNIVTAAVAAAEGQTSGEIVTVLAEASDGYTDVALWWAIAAAFTAMTVLATFTGFYTGILDWIVGGWASDWTAAQLLGTLVALGLIKFLAVLLIQYWAPLRFFLIPGPVKAARVREQAIKHFKVGAERRTHGRTGVLIYLSMRERRAEIVADETIAAIVEPEVWGEAMGDMLAEIRKGRIAQGLAEGVKDVGWVLAQHFPREEDDQNELPDRLIEV